MVEYFPRILASEEKATTTTTTITIIRGLADFLPDEHRNPMTEEASLDPEGPEGVNIIPGSKSGRCSEESL